MTDETNARQAREHFNRALLALRPLSREPDQHSEDALAEAKVCYHTAVYFRKLVKNAELRAPLEDLERHVVAAMYGQALWEAMLR